MQKYPQIAQRWLACALLASFPASMDIYAESVPQSVEFNRDIRPILSDKCFTCHGPDAANRKTKLRFDVESSAKAKIREGVYAITPGDPEKSELFRRITSDNKAVRMPPAYAKKEKLTDKEI